jgi:hypothetical protein
MNDLQIIESRQLSVVDRLLMNKASQRTREAYADDLQHFAVFIGGGSSRKILDSDFQWFDPALIAAYAEWLKQQVSAHTGRPYSTATIARRLTAVRELLTEATFLGLYPRENLEYIRGRLSTPEGTSVHHGSVTPDEQDKLLAIAAEQPGLKGTRDYAMFRLWLDTGLRRNELASLKAGDLVIKNGVPTLIVRHELSAVLPGAKNGPGQRSRLCGGQPGEASAWRGAESDGKLVLPGSWGAKQSDAAQFPGGAGDGYAGWRCAYPARAESDRSHHHPDDHRHLRPQPVRRAGGPLSEAKFAAAGTGWMIPILYEEVTPAVRNPPHHKVTSTRCGSELRRYRTGRV